MAANNTDQGRGKPPVFIPCRNLPDNTENGFQYTVRELCAAAEKTSGYNSGFSLRCRSSLIFFVFGGKYQ